MSENEKEPIQKKKPRASKKTASLEEIAKSEWGTDQAELKLEKTSPSTEAVTLISDPFGIRTPEISDFQNDEDAMLEDDLSLSENSDSVPLEDSNAQLEKIAAAMADEHAKNVEDLKTLAEATPEISAAEDLAQQIAEDEALAQAEASALAEDEIEELSPELAAALPQRNEAGELDLEEVQSCAETLIFMSEKPLSLKKIKELLGIELESQVIRDALAALQERYSAQAHGIELAQVAGGYQFRSKPIRAPLAMKLAKVQSQRLSRGAMESLAIIAYKQPTLKDDIDKIRGVDSSHFIRVLLDKKLIHMSGRSELPGRPILYSTTSEFLEIFGLADLSSLPPLRELEQMVPASESGNAEDEDPKVKEMRRLVAEMKADKHRLAYDPKEDEKILGDIRERVKSIPTSTPYLEHLKAIENGEIPADSVMDLGPAQMSLEPAVAETPMPDQASEESPAEAEQVLTEPEAEVSAAIADPQ